MIAPVGEVRDAHDEYTLEKRRGSGTLDDVI
jgi:hypothetical protein